MRFFKERPVTSKGFWFWSSSSKSLVTEPQNVFFRKNGNSFCPRLSHEEALWCIMSTPTTVSAQRLWQFFWSLTACLHFWRPNPVTWRSMCTWRKLTWTLVPPLPDPFKNECFQNRARLLARFSPRLLKHLKPWKILLSWKIMVFFFVLFWKKQECSVFRV